MHIFKETFNEYLFKNYLEVISEYKHIYGIINKLLHKIEINERKNVFMMIFSLLEAEKCKAEKFNSFDKILNENKRFDKKFTIKSDILPIYYENEDNYIYQDPYIIKKGNIYNGEILTKKQDFRGLYYKFSKKDNFSKE